MNLRKRPCRVQSDARQAAPTTAGGGRPVRAGPTRRGRAFALGLVVVIALLGAGCTGPADEAVAPTAAPDPATAEPDAATEAPDPPAGDSTPGPDEPGIAGPLDEPAGDPADGCGDALAELDAVIGEQLAAFAADDWERALSLTSQRFRASGVDADGLREIVTSGYAPAADAERHDVIGCVRTGGEAQVLIDVTAAGGASIGLVYLMERENGSWRISGAVAHGSGPQGGEGDTPIEA